MKEFDLRKNADFGVGRGKRKRDRNKECCCRIVQIMDSARISVRRTIN